MKKTFLAIVSFTITSVVYAQSDYDSTRNRVKMSPPDINNYSNKKSNSDKTRDGINPNQNLNNNQSQDLQNNSDSSMHHETIDTSNPDGVLMKDGKMMTMKNGKATPMDRDIAISNATKITINGIIVKSDGSKRTMNEGEYINVSGKIIPEKN